MIRALSIQQPWAWLIVNGHKDIENRTWRTDRRGRVLIHAGKSFDKDFDWHWARELLARQAPATQMPPPEQYELGGIVGQAEIVGCVAAHDSPWFFGPWGFVLAKAQPLPFRPVKGALGFFDPQPAAPEPAEPQGSLDL